MFYIEENDKVVLFDDNRTKLENTLVFMPQYQGLEIKELEEGYVISDFVIMTEEEYQAQQTQKERERLDALTLTPADVERALYKAKQMDFEDLKALIVPALPTVDIKALSIEFRAKDFYRGAEANGMRLFDVVGALLGYTSADMDYLFENKKLPAVDIIDGSDEGSETHPASAIEEDK